MADGQKVKGRDQLQTALRMKLDGVEAEEARQALSQAN
jgi:hypothetical protein